MGPHGSSDVPGYPFLRATNSLCQLSRDPPDAGAPCRECEVPGSASDKNADDAEDSNEDDPCRSGGASIRRNFDVAPPTARQAMEQRVA